MYQYVALTNGTTVIDFTDNISYALVSYAPGVAYLNDNVLGPLYIDVVDQLTFHAIGCTAAEAYSAAAAVNTLLDQARRWASGETVTAVRLQIQAQNSTLTLPLETCIKGRADGGSPPLALPEQRAAYEGNYVIPNITIQFVRRGQLLFPTAESGVSSAAANPTVQSITISTPTAISSPTGLSYSYQDTGVDVNAVVERAVILTASAANRLQIYEAEGGVKGANIATQADAANEARGGSVARYSPGALTSQIVFTMVSWDSSAEKIAVWAAVKNNSATTTFTIQIKDRDTQLTAIPVVVDVAPATGAVPQIMFLGMLSVRLGLNTLELVVTASAASGTLDIDYIVVQAVDDETSGALAISSVFTTTPLFIVGLVGFRPTVVDPQVLSEPVAIATSASGSSRRALNYVGDPYFYTRGSFVAVFLATGGNPATFWRAVDAGNDVVDTIVTATRYGAYLVPQ